MVTLATAAIPDEMFAGLGNVPPVYRHEYRVVTPAEPLVLPRSVFKWYHVHRVSEPVPPEIDVEARAVTSEAMATGAWDPSYGLNIAILHVSTTHAFLLLGVWRGHQELWERIYARELIAVASFVRVDATGEDAPVGCVWELAATCHERVAWHRYLFSDRTNGDKRDWLADVYTGRA
jgi:hypothetical protein